MSRWLYWSFMVTWLTAGTLRAELPIQVDPPDQPPSHRIMVPPPVGGASHNTGTVKPPPPAIPGVPQLIVTLSDGSRLLGQTKLKELSLESDALGKLSVPLANIRELKLGKEFAATLTLQNGDKIQARLRLEKFDLETSFGAVVVPVQHVTQLQLQSAGEPSKPKPSAD
jgi:hypothetical protein